MISKIGTIITLQEATILSLEEDKSEEEGNNSDNNHIYFNQFLYFYL
jgi:hypothetical protein